MGRGGHRLVVQLVDLAVRRVEALLVEVEVESLLADGAKDGADDTFDGSLGRYEWTLER